MCKTYQRGNENISPVNKGIEGPVSGGRETQTRQKDLQYQVKELRLDSKQQKHVVHKFLNYMPPGVEAVPLRAENAQR